MLNICRVLPDMYIMMKFMGKDFPGARASSQAFLRKRSSVSDCVGGGLGGVVGFCWREGVSLYGYTVVEMRADLVPTAAACEPGRVGDFPSGSWAGDGWDVGDVDDPLGRWMGGFNGLHGVWPG